MGELFSAYEEYCVTLGTEYSCDYGYQDGDRCYYCNEGSYNSYNNTCSVSGTVYITRYQNSFYIEYLVSA